MCSYSYELNVRFRAWWVVVVQLQCCVSRGEKRSYMHCRVMGVAATCVYHFTSNSSKHGDGRGWFAFAHATKQTRAIKTLPSQPWHTGPPGSHCVHMLS
jgi:hypothetical protein